MIDYTSTEQIAEHRSIAVGALTANVASIVSLTLINERPWKLEWALVLFAASLPLLAFSASCLGRTADAASRGQAIAKRIQYSISTCLLVGSVATSLGYTLFMWHFSVRAVIAFVSAMMIGLVVSRLVHASLHK